MESFISMQDGKTYGVTAVHGESGSLFHVVDIAAPEDYAMMRSCWSAMGIA